MSTKPIGIEYLDQLDHNADPNNPCWCPECSFQRQAEYYLAETDVPLPLILGGISKALILLLINLRPEARMCLTEDMLDYISDSVEFFGNNDPEQYDDTVH